MEKENFNINNTIIESLVSSKDKIVLFIEPINVVKAVFRGNINVYLGNLDQTINNSKEELFNLVITRIDWIKDIQWNEQLIQIINLSLFFLRVISQFTIYKFDPHRETSLSAQFTSKSLDFPDLGQSIKFDIWDTVGQEKYSSLAKIFNKDAKVIIFVYDVTTENSFQSLKNYWYDETKSNWDGTPILTVVGNKIDLYNEIKVNNIYLYAQKKDFANVVYQ